MRCDALCNGDVGAGGEINGTALALLLFKITE